MIWTYIQHLELKISKNTNLVKEILLTICLRAKNEFNFRKIIKIQSSSKFKFEY
jgi:hypothetical protein